MTMVTNNIQETKTNNSCHHVVGALFIGFTNNSPGSSLFQEVFLTYIKTKL